MAKVMFRHFCRDCGAAFATNRTDKEFCSTEHQRRFLNMRIKQGLRLIDLAINSRIDRSAENLPNAHKARRDLYVEISRICDDERSRRARRSAKIAEIKAAGSLPQPVEPITSNDDITTESPISA